VSVCELCVCHSVSACTAAYSDAATLGQDAAAAEGEYLQLGGVKLHCMDGQVHAVSSTAKRRTVHVVRPPSSLQKLHARPSVSFHAPRNADARPRARCLQKRKARPQQDRMAVDRELDAQRCVGGGLGAALCQDVGVRELC